MVDDEPRLIRTVEPGAGQEVTSTVDDEHVEITKNGNNVVAFMKASFIEVDMTWIFWQGRRRSARFINFRICLPSSICQQHSVEGHLGNCNEDNSDDHSRGPQRRLYIITIIMQRQKLW